MISVLPAAGGNTADTLESHFPKQAEGLAGKSGQPFWYQVETAQSCLLSSSLLVVASLPFGQRLAGLSLH
jgi:hypothetical protein